MKWFGHSSSWGVGLCALIVLVLSLSMPDTMRESRVQNLLRQLHENEAKLTRDILLVNYGEIRHYDTLVTTLQQLDVTIEEIDRELKDSAEISPKDMLITERYKVELEVLRLQIEQFKSEHAILKNSRNFLFRLLEKFHKLKTKRSLFDLGRLGNIERNIQERLLSSGRFSASMPSRGLDNRMSEVEQQALHFLDDPELYDVLINLSRHSALVTMYSNVSRMLLKEILSGKHIIVSTEMEKRIEAWRQRVNQRQTIYNYSLIAAVFFGAVLVLILFRRMASLAGRLETANSTLETRVKQRTSALEVSNGKLEREIEERRIAEKTVQKLAWKDSLTGLSNRSYMNHQLERVLSPNNGVKPELSLLLLDLDGFKSVNDQFGHPVGDQLLQAIGKRIEHTCRPGDIISRLGGDEFAIILVGKTEPETVVAIADRLKDIIHRPVDVDGLSIQVGVSVGVVHAPADATESHELMRKADMALYHAKSSGRNQVSQFEERLDLELQERRKLEMELRSALETGEGLKLAYQPKICLKTGGISGLEALFRWTHPTRGVMRPDFAIEIAEESGLIVELGLWVLKQAACQMKHWLASGMMVDRVWVNVSARQLRQDTFINHLQLIMAETGILPRNIGLEITESLELDNEAFLVEKLEQISMAGIYLAIDDFGTGYSSLTYLRQLPVNSLKIDKSFVSDMLASPEDRAITSAAIQLGHALNLPVVAEGVETVDQFHELIDLECDEAQGYLFTKPLEAHQLELWLAAYWNEVTLEGPGQQKQWHGLGQQIENVRHVYQKQLDALSNKQTHLTLVG